MKWTTEKPNELIAFLELLPRISKSCHDRHGEKPDIRYEIGADEENLARLKLSGIDIIEERPVFGYILDPTLLEQIDFFDKNCNFRYMQEWLPPSFLLAAPKAVVVIYLRNLFVVMCH